jgi:uncharacterized protein with ParB-like and HNH nuclease domain
MSYDVKSIQQVIKDIDGNKIYLPAIQRKFVWKKRQIELLFDSIMRKYPYGTFLFWYLHRDNADNYVFYEFLKEYDERNPYNRRKTGSFLHNEIIGVLDGQQRLSSIYIGLMGTHTERTPYQRINNPNAFEKKSLYLNLINLPYTVDQEKDEIILDEGKNFDFKFLAHEEDFFWSVRKRDVDGQEVEDPLLWFKVGKVLSWNDGVEYEQKIKLFLNNNDNDLQRKTIEENKRLIIYTLRTLHTRINSDQSINYFQIKKDDLEDILKIFIRVNSGGTVLSKTDLLFSTIVATWDDGRQKIEKLQEKINQKGDKFNFSNEFLMRCCLLLVDAPVVYKVHSFKSENVNKIQNEWTRIETAILKTVDLLVEFGFDGSRLTSQNAVIIMAYHIYKGGDLSENSKKGMRLYLIHALLNQIYSNAQDQLLDALRNGLRHQENEQVCYSLKSNEFSFDTLLKIRLPGRKSLAISKNDIEDFLLYKKGPVSFMLLSLLYPHLRYQDQVFHQDHIHPYSAFNPSNLAAIGVGKERHEEWMKLRDTVANLQLLNRRVNESKNATPLNNWIQKMPQSEHESYFRENFFPEGVSLEFASFMDFYKKRKEILRKKLETILAVSSDTLGFSDIGDEGDYNLDDEDNA